jgi:pimeloyl-ACP methyl ester carboxylesterase
MQTTQGIAHVNGTQLYYEAAGAGSALVLIHGHTLDIRMWDAQFETFASQYYVIRYDMRGYGRSDLPGTAVFAPADDLNALLSYLGVAHAHVLGLSRGGVVAIDFALAYPSKTHTLIVADTALREFPWQAFGEFTQAVKSAATGSGIDAARQRWQQGALFAPAMEQPQVAARLAQMVADYSGWHWLNQEPVRLLEPPPTQQLDTITAPTLVIVGERDLPEFQAIADLVHQRVPNASKAIMPGVGHMSNMEDPAFFNTLVLEFIAGHSD